MDIERGRRQTKTLTRSANEDGDDAGAVGIRTRPIDENALNPR